MKSFLNKLLALPEKIMDIILGILDGLKIQVSTARGAVIIIIVVVLILDIIQKGSMGLMAELIKQIKHLFDTLPKDGWFIVSVVLIILMLKKRA